MSTPKVLTIDIYRSLTRGFFEIIDEIHSPLEEYLFSRMEKDSKVLYFLVKITVSVLKTKEVDESEVDESQARTLYVDYIVSDLYIPKISIPNLKFLLRRDFVVFLLDLITKGKLNTFVLGAQVRVKEGSFRS